MTILPALEDFVRTEGTRFTIGFSDITIPLFLINALPLPPVPEGPGVPATIRRVPYTLDFRGPLEFPLQQNLYRLSHDDLGEVDLFLVPVGRDEDGLYYHVVIN